MLGDKNERDENNLIIAFLNYLQNYSTNISTIYFQYLNLNFILLCLLPNYL